MSGIVDDLRALAAKGERPPDPMGTRMTRRYFGTDGIRGKANAFPMTADIAMKVGIGRWHVFPARKTTATRVVLGKDTRLSGYNDRKRHGGGILRPRAMDVSPARPDTDAGRRHAGPLAAGRYRRHDLGLATILISIMESKLFGPDGYKLSDQIERRIEAIIDGGVDIKLADSASLGRAKARGRGCMIATSEFAKRTLPRALSLSGMRIVVDCANGAAYKVAPAALWELGAEVVAIGDEPNGLNINENCGSTSVDALMRKVLRGAGR